MSKDPLFIGQPVMTQLLKYLPSKDVLKTLAKKTGADRYTKKFDSIQHLSVFLFAVLGRLDTLREVTTGLAGHEKKLNHIGVNGSVARSTFAHANKTRNPEFFFHVYLKTYEKFKHLILDSRLKSAAREKDKRLYALDATTISLFTNIFAGTNIVQKNGQQKGGLKVHTLLDVVAGVPSLFKITDAIRSDASQMGSLINTLPSGSILLADRGYVDYVVQEAMTRKGIIYITRIKKNIKFKTLQDLNTPDEGNSDDKDNTVLFDKIISLKIDMLTKTEKKILEELNILEEFKDLPPEHKARLVCIWNEKKKSYDAYLTGSNNTLSPEEIALLYAQRWRIESLFKQLKQNFNLSTFLGDNRNAIIIQIIVTMLANLLVTMLKLSITNKKTAFSVMVKNLNILLMTYIDIIDFFNDTEASKRIAQEMAKKAEEMGARAAPLFPLED